MEQKSIIIPFEGGYAKLNFVKQGDDWVCKVPDQSMQDLESYMSGKPYRETVRWIDTGGLGE